MKWEKYMWNPMTQTFLFFLDLLNNFFLPSQKECSDAIFVNGDKVYTKRELHENDRLIFGSSGNAFFLVKNPFEEAEIYGQESSFAKKEIGIDWETIQMEFMAKVDKEKRKQEEIHEKEKEQIGSFF